MRGPHRLQLFLDGTVRALARRRRCHDPLQPPLPQHLHDLSADPALRAEYEDPGTAGAGLQKPCQTGKWAVHAMRAGRRKAWCPLACAPRRSACMARARHTRDGHGDEFTLPLTE